VHPYPYPPRKNEVVGSYCPGPGTLSKFSFPFPALPKPYFGPAE